MTRIITSVHQKWILLFSLWLVFLSGVFSSFIDSPGILQAIELNQLRNLKENYLKKVQNTVTQLKADVHALENQQYLQIKEIRRILGYVAEDEIVFDFAFEDGYANR